ncbi:MAG: hypothetical protein HZY76_05805 [Anaerolineae bacterium]|nr:MAG: hypothetical protein HZY76_05805 [Anaerolineae bacterium]
MPRDRPGTGGHSRAAAGPAKWPRARTLLLLASLSLAALAVLRFAQQGEDGVVQIAWLGGLLLFLASQAPRPRRRAWSDLAAQLRRVPPATWWPCWRWESSWSARPGYA